MGEARSSLVQETRVTVCRDQTVYRDPFTLSDCSCFPKPYKKQLKGGFVLALCLRRDTDHHDGECVVQETDRKQEVGPGSLEYI